MNIRNLTNKLEEMIKNDGLSKTKKMRIEEAYKDACGLEVTEENTKEICKEYGLFQVKETDELARKIRWIKLYMDTVEKEQLIGLKISNAGTIEYILNKQRYEEPFIIYVGDTYQNSTKLRNDRESGLLHMKYGDSNHWKKSKAALSTLPQHFKGKRFVKNSGEGEYNYMKVVAGGTRFIFGVPKEAHYECILLSCY